MRWTQNSVDLPDQRKADAEPFGDRRQPGMGPKRGDGADEVAIGRGRRGGEEQPQRAGERRRGEFGQPRLAFGRDHAATTDGDERAAADQRDGDRAGEGRQRRQQTDQRGGDARGDEDGEPPRRRAASIERRAESERDQRQRRIGLIKPAFALDEEGRQRAERGQRRRRDERRAQARPGDQRERRRQRRPCDDRGVDDEVARRLAHRQIGGGDRRQDVVDIGGKTPGDDARIGERRGGGESIFARPQRRAEAAPRREIGGRADEQQPIGRFDGDDRRHAQAGDDGRARASAAPAARAAATASAGSASSATKKSRSSKARPGSSVKANSAAPSEAGPSSPSSPARLRIAAAAATAAPQAAKPQAATTNSACAPSARASATGGR